MQKFQRRKIPLMILSGAALLSVQGPNALAQAEGPSFAIEKVIVTARRRTESMQDTPIAVSAISIDSLREAGITNLADITEQVPNLQIARPSRDANI